MKQLSIGVRDTQVQGYGNLGTLMKYLGRERSLNCISRHHWQFDFSSTLHLLLSGDR